jgi:hypothetical protein
VKDLREAIFVFIDTLEAAAGTIRAAQALLIVDARAAGALGDARLDGTASEVLTARSHAHFKP